MQQCCNLKLNKYICNIVAFVFIEIMEANEVLRKHSLKRTSCREGIINTIIRSGEALSEAEIKDRLVGDFDRTTFYRSFKTLEENHILHKIVVDNQLVKYAIDNTLTQKNTHGHFYCQLCECVLCMDSVSVSMPQLPEGFQAESVELIIKGICKKCSNN